MWWKLAASDLAEAPEFFWLALPGLKAGAM
jgi:hypothetical protein